MGLEGHFEGINCPFWTLLNLRLYSILKTVKSNNKNYRKYMK